MRVARSRRKSFYLAASAAASAAARAATASATASSAARPATAGSGGSGVLRNIARKSELLRISRCSPAL